MDKVQFQLESTLPELKDLHEKGLFSKNEIDSITRRRTQFETSLIRKGIKKEDFFKYAEYEIGLERLRKIRFRRLGYHRNPPPPSASMYSIPRRIVYILKRATVKFPAEIETWLAYIEYAGQEGMRKLVAKGLNSALQHHPLSSTLYLLSSYNHLHPGSPFPRSVIPSSSTLNLPSAQNSQSSSSVTKEEEPSSFALEGIQQARTTILLGLRLLPKDHDLWTEYIKLELGWVEALRRRWSVLGISTSSAETGAKKPRGETDGGAGAFGEDGEEARKAIMAGELIFAAINSSLKSITSKDDIYLNFRKRLISLLRTYPSPLRTVSLENIYQDLKTLIGEDIEESAEAQMILLTKGLYDRSYESGQKDVGGIVVEGVELIEELGKIGKEIRRIAKLGNGKFGEIAGKWISEQIKANQLSAELNQYLLSVMASLTKPKSNPTTTLLMLHLSHLNPNTPEYTNTVEVYCQIHPSFAPLQLIRLQNTQSQSQLQSASDIESIIKRITKSDLSFEEETAVEKIWHIWLTQQLSLSVSGSRETEKVWSKVLNLSLRISAAKDIHQSLLIKYFEYLITTSQVSFDTALKVIQAKYQPKSPLFKHILRADELNSSQTVAPLIKVFESWRATCKTSYEKRDAAVFFAKVLLLKGKAREAMNTIENVKKDIQGNANEVSRLEREWQVLLSRSESERQADDENDDQDDGEEMNGDGIFLDVGEDQEMSESVASP